MPIPRMVARLNKVGLNRVTRHIAPWMPGLGVVVHRGRRSGRVYETPVNVFTVGDGYVIALTYGPGTDWVKNVLAAGGCELRTRGRVVRLTAPRVFRDETRHDIRPLERQVLRLIGVADFLSLAREPAASRNWPGLSGPHIYDHALADRFGANLRRAWRKCWGGRYRGD